MTAAHDAGSERERIVAKAARALFAEEQCDKRQYADLEANWMGRLSDRDRHEYLTLARAVIDTVRADIEAGALDAAARSLNPPLCATCANILDDRADRLRGQG